MPTARKVCLDALNKIEKNKAYSNIELDNIIQKFNLEGKDKAFATSLFYGVIERKLTLDYIISLYSKTPVQKLQTEVINILRMGIYQSLYMDKVPERAAVNESVKLAQGKGLIGAKGFINAVLRNIIREKDNIKLPKKGTLEHLSVVYSCPKETVKLLCDAYGEKICEDFLESSFGRPPLSVRTNTLKVTSEKLILRLKDEGISAVLHNSIDDALNISKDGFIFSSKAFEEGLFHVQDAASQLCARILSPKSGDTVYDVCAAPGGKTATIAQLMENNGSIIACDLHENKLSLIKETADRLGIDIIKVKQRNAKTVSEDDAKAERVLCDVPCSGLGIIRRKPEIRYKDVSELEKLAKIQYEILDNSASLVKNGGTLVYSTCTLNPKENIDVVTRFLSLHPEFSPKPLILPEGINRIIDEPKHVITLFPQSCGTDGFFISCFVKDE